jgi:hypothetical protein
MATLKRKAEQAQAVQMEFSTGLSIPAGRGAVKENFGEKLWMSVCGPRRGLELAQRRGPGEILRFAQDDNGSGASL